MKISDKMIRDIASGTIYKRGVEYFKKNRVHIKKPYEKENQIDAVVDGSLLYNVQLRFNDGKIDYMFCSCPYYATMNRACKHIVAAAKQYQADCENTHIYNDTDNELAESLCRSFRQEPQYDTQPLPIAFMLKINPVQPSSFYKSNRYYTLDIRNKLSNTLFDIKNFIKSYTEGTEYKVGTRVEYSPKKHHFSDNDKKALDMIVYILSERNIENSSRYFGLHNFAISERTAQRLLEFDGIDIEFFYNGSQYKNIKKYYENPDILVDISAYENNINLSVPDKGISLFSNGSWFLFENDLYKTDDEFIKWYMTIYSFLEKENRNQIDFKGSTAIKFVRDILPRIKDKHGVTQNGTEKIIVDDIPIFSVYLDRYTKDGINGISAAVRVSYGDITITLPDEEEISDRILLRDTKKENYILSFFKKFYRSGIYYILDNEELIYDFITSGLDEILREVSVYYSDSFKNIKIRKKFDMSVSADYNFGIDLLEAGFESELSYEEIAEILSAVKERKRFYRLNDGSFFDIYNNEMEIMDILSDLEFSRDDLKNGKKKLNKRDMMYLASFDGIKLSDDFNKMYRKIKNIKADIPDYLDNVLREYQKTGVDWLTQLAECGFGGILADDMGLGKTLQVIAFAASQKHTMPSIIIAPSSLVYNWQNEIGKFAPEKKSLIIEGNKIERKFLLSTYGEYDFVITSYPLIRRDIEDYKDIEFENCFIDEAQYIKNPKTMNAISVKLVNAKHKFALTGTPIENSLSELWSIFDFLMPNYLYSHTDFVDNIEKPIVKDGNESVLKKVKNKIKPFLLRRMKSDVLNELPEKIETVIYADMTNEQKKEYSAYMALAKKEIGGLSDERYTKNKIQILAMLTRLRQICCHPSLFDENYKKDSGKLILLEEIISDAIGGNHRVIVFSQFTSMLDIIKERLDKSKTSYFYLSGATKSEQRTDMAERFNGGEKQVFLISLKAGGTGLNLVGADTVIHYDPWWNPAVMEQASDRVYRIGQKKNVQIIKLISKGTIEEKIMLLQEKKKDLAGEIITTNQTSLGKLSKAEILSLIN